MYMIEWRVGPTTFEFVGEDPEGLLIYRIGSHPDHPLTEERVQKIVDWLEANDEEARDIVGGDVLGACLSRDRNGSLFLVILAD